MCESSSYMPLPHAYMHAYCRPYWSTGASDCQATVCVVVASRWLTKGDKSLDRKADSAFPLNSIVLEWPTIRVGIMRVGAQYDRGWQILAVPIKRPHLAR
jgi:hypothetical protein